MRRCLALVTVVMACLLALPAAHAQTERRDPFDPVIDLDATTGEPQQGAQAPGTEPGPSDPARPVEVFPATGRSTAPWLVTAYGALVTGAGLLYLSRLRRSPAR